MHNGQANGLLLFVTSLHRAHIPLAAFDPGDPRVLRVAPDSLIIGLLDAAGSFTLDVPLPNNPALSGFPLANQVATGPGTTTIVDQLSEVLVVPVRTGGMFHAEPPIMASVRSFATSIPLADGELLIVGGGTGTLLFQNGQATSEIWDPVVNTMRPGPNMIAPRSGHTQTRLQDGRFLLAGGVNAMNMPQTSCEIFDPQTGLFSAAASMTAVRTHHTATLLSDGRVLIAGGIQNMSDPTSAVTSSTSSTTIYNPANNTWTPGPLLTRPRGGHMAVHLGNGKVLLCGGISWTTFFGIRSPNLQARSDLFDEVNNTVAAGPLMATTRALAGMFVMSNGRALVVGGMTGNVARVSPGKAFLRRSQGQRRRPSNGKWGEMGSRCVTLSDGTMIAVGGASGDLYTPLPSATCETLDPVTGAWSSFSALSTARAAPTVAPLQTCGVAVFGGSTTGSALSSAPIELLARGLRPHAPAPVSLSCSLGLPTDGSTADLARDQPPSASTVRTEFQPRFAAASSGRV